MIAVYEEIVSGESLVHRPEMLKLLQKCRRQEIRCSFYAWIMDRLGRGGMKEQGIIL
ncbi:hypothetical protein ACT7DN_00075 [Bacillus paranthracis]